MLLIPSLFNHHMLHFRPSIDIIAENPSGAFYAVQSLISLAEHTRMNHMYRIPVGIVTVSVYGQLH